MFYFGRIISAFFNQLFRFLLWNKFGQKLLIILIISLIAFWCVGMTKVHAVSEVEDINYEVYHYYDQVINDVILRLESLRRVSPDNAVFTYINNPGYYFYFYYGDPRGTSYNNATPINQSRLYILPLNKGWVNGGTFVLTPNNSDYMGVTGFDMFNITKSDNSNFSAFDIDNNNNIRQVSYAQYSINRTLMLYTSTIWREYIEALNNNDVATITTLLEDIKAEQQATNDFLNEETDTSNMVIDTPSVTDTASDNMSNNLHEQINTLTTNLQSTVANYYEGQDAYTWKIPWPSYIGGYLTFDSGVTRRIIGSNGVIYNIIQAIWVVLFGGYIVGFIKRMLDWVQTGKIFDEGGIADFIWWMDTNNEIIKASMM